MAAQVSVRISPIRAIAVCYLLAAFTPAQCETVSFDVADANAWEVFQDEDATAIFGFDYSPLGIPGAPSSGDDDTVGIYLAANLEDPAEAAGIAVSPKGFVATGKYTVKADMWLNYYADIDNVGTTEFGGMFVGFDGVEEGAIFGAGLLADTDGDTSRDYRLYNQGLEISIETGQYDIASQNNTDPDLAAQFPGAEVPDAQVDLDNFDPANEPILANDGTMAFEWHTLEAEVDAQAGTAAFSIDGLEIGTIDASIEDSLVLEGSIAFAITDIFSSVAPVSDFAFALFDNITVDIEQVTTIGDFDADGDLDLADIDSLVAAIRTQSGDAQFDLNQDGAVDLADLTTWVTDAKQTWIGDSNLDGEFNSSDFVLVFQNGEYEDGIASNSTWAEGDWNADGEFSSTDFVLAFQDGGFERGPRAAAQVPEPAARILGLAIPIVFCRRKRR